MTGQTLEQTLVSSYRNDSSLIATLPKSNGSVKPGLHANLDYSQQQLLERLDGFEAPYLKEKLMSEEVFKTIEEYQHAFTEFKKFAGLAALYDKTISMTSKDVDSVWHQFILFTRQYHDFCKDYVGEYLHHNPRTSLTPLAKDSKNNFIELYQKTYGQIPAIWNVTEDCSVCSNHCHGAPSCDNCDDGKN